MNALDRDRGSVCLGVIGAIRDHTQDPVTNQRTLDKMKRERPGFLKVMKDGKRQGDLAAKFPIAATSNKHSNRELVAAVDQLVDYDLLSIEAVEKLCLETKD